MSDTPETKSPVKATPVRAKVIKTEDAPEKVETKAEPKVEATPVAQPEVKVEAPEAKPAAQVEAKAEAPKAEEAAKPVAKAAPKAQPKKAAAKPTPKKAQPKKEEAVKPAAVKKAAPKKAPVKKAAPKKVAPKKVEPKNTPAISTDNLQDVQAQIAVQFQTALTQSTANLNAVIKSSDAIANGMQKMTEIWMELATGLVEDQMKAAEAVSSCETLADLLKVQAKLAQEEYDLVVEETEKLTKVSTKVAEEALQPLNERFDAAVKSMSETAYF